GNDVVYTFKESKSIPWLKRVVVKIFYKLMTKISGLELHFGQSDFRLIDKKILNVILTMPEYHKFLRGQIRWAGFKQIGIPFAVEPRHSGESKFSFKDLFMFALDGLLGFSRYPLHVITLIGFVVGFFSLLFIFKEIFLSWLLNAPLPPGWASLTAAVFFLGSIQLIAIGILGEYVGRIFDQTKQRPNFIIKEMSQKT
ncbi:MAG: glycosyltransferase, partial [Deltaproteobacteria bacterium]